MTLQVRLFGAFQLADEGQLVKWNALPKTTPLLAYLLLNGATPLARDAVAFALWPDMGEAEARSNLRRHLHDLRRALPAAPPAQPWLLADSDGIQWNPANRVWVDAVVFAALSADLSRLGEAVTLYTGDLLPNLYDEWLVFHRERLRTLLVDDLVQLVQQRRSARDYPNALAYAQQILQHEPLREDAVRWLMTLRHESGDRTGALQEYHRFTQRLREALDVPPMVETSALYDAIARQLVAPSPAVALAPATVPAPSTVGADELLSPGNLPAQLTTFVGRDHEIVTVRALLTTAEVGVRLLTLTGAGGCGKTRLALEVAARLRREQPNPFPDGYFFVSLSGLSDASLVVPAVASALDIRESGNETLLTSVKEHLRTRRTLLILDNFEHVAAAAPLLTELLSVAPGLRMMVTSRAVLHLYGEHEYPVATLPVPEADEAGGLESVARYDAVALFTTRSRAVNPQFVLHAENAATIAEICRRLDGLPLAIELAAARSKLLTAPALLARLTGALGGRLTFLVDRNRNLEERHQTLRSTLSWSYALLAPAEQRLFQQLAVFVGSFSYEAAEAVCGPEAALDLLAGLETLVDNSLLNRVDSELPASGDLRYEELRFQMLSIIREYGLEQFERAPGAQEVYQRQARFFLALAHQAEPLLQGADQLAWLKRLELERENWRSALSWSLREASDEPGLALELAATLGDFWVLYGYWAEGHRWLTEALARAPAAPSLLRAKALFALGAIIHAQGHLREAEPVYAESLTLYRLNNDDRGMADALYGLGRIANRLGRYAEAEASLQESLVRARRAGHTYRIAYSLNILAFVYNRHGERALAHATYEQALTTARANQDRAGMAFILTAVGELARQEGDYAKAAAYYDEAMALARTLGQKARVMMLLHNQGYVVLQRGDAGNAAASFRACLKQGLELPDKENFGMCLVGLGCVAVVEGQTPRAVRLFAAGARTLADLGADLVPADQMEFDRYLALARERMPAERFARLWAEGQALTPEQAQALALA